jgi:hypothetical protein
LGSSYGVFEAHPPGNVERRFYPALPFEASR